MAGGSLARRYAKALMQIGVEEGTLSKIGNDVGSLAKAVKDSNELLKILTNPAFPRSKREPVILALLGRIGANQSVINFSRLLLDKDRMAYLVDISRELDAMIQSYAGKVKAEVTSAAPLSAEQKSRLTAKLEALSGRKITMETREDPSLLGGVVARVGDMIYDGSLKTQLQHLREELAS